ncbi:hypothetical protein [Antrihabitans stalactiti]|jgi:hypothetical protein|uniref:Uncharacterized protein n=1 Tax=Antrihabitans stalactiti TaxID=2584121 RepID=A0A848KQW0_9NOCA|nr:hypothetical protein [Antrihabitans stalactiti]NMN99294.1 hypothetical protein [Antrihabitans stalactiti]
MTTTEWQLTVTTFAGDLIDAQRGCSNDRNTAICELFAAAHDHVVERDTDILPVYTLILAGQMIGFVATGQTPRTRHPDLGGVIDQLQVVETAVRTVTLERRELIRRR